MYYYNDFMKNTITILLLSLSLLVGAKVIAADSLYQAQVEVLNTSTQEQQAALPKALEQVLVKVTGNQDVLKQLTIQTALSSPEAYLDSYSYTNKGKKTTINVLFSSVAIQKLLNNSGQQVWKNRPTMLVWLTIVKNDDGPVLVSDTNQQFADDIYANAARRGLQVVLPVGDLQDLSAKTDDQNYPAILGRYRADVIFVGSMTANSTGEWQASWNLPTVNKTLNISGTDTSKLLKSAMDAAVNDLSQQMRATSVNNNAEIIMKVTDVNGVSDYTQLLNYLSTLSAVKKITPEKIDVNFVKLRISLIGGVQSLNNSLQQNDKMLLLNSQEKGVDLIYQWHSK
jgi:hypothetical protein